MKTQVDGDTDELTVKIKTEAIRLPEGLSPWILSIKNHVGTQILSHLTENTDRFDRYLECVPVADIPGAFLCCSFYQRDINEALTRMGLFMGAGKGFSEGTVVSLDDPTLINYKKLVAGHNLPSPVISNFYRKVSGFNPFEEAFHKEFVQSPLVKSMSGRFYVIGFPSKT